MVQIIFKDHTGKEYSVQIAEGLSVMEGAVKHNIAGIEADCGGACACATCHVYVSDEWKDKITPAAPAEEDMLDFAFDVRPTSRLSCQIQVNSNMDGMIVNIPEKQF